MPFGVFTNKGFFSGKFRKPVYGSSMTWELHELSDESLQLLSIDGLGGLTLGRLVTAECGIEELGRELIQGSLDDLLPNGSGDLLRLRMKRQDSEALRMSAFDSGSKIVTAVDDDFPALLRPLPACPAILWYRGNLLHVSSPGVGIVGSRRCSQYGRDQATNFSQSIASAGLTVISGGARGIDGESHKGALRVGGATIAVLGSGIRMPYPPEHAKLFDQIVDEGGLVLSEFPCDRPPRPANFPRRNRIVAGLSSAVLVIEAARRSGALITARIAVEEHGREAFVLPGRIGDIASAGCLRVLSEGWVQLALEPEVVIEESKAAYKRLSSGNYEARL